MQRMRAKGRTIAHLRDSLDLTQEELSFRVGYSVKTIWKAESSGVLRRRTLEDIAVALKSTLNEIADPADLHIGALPDRQVKGFANEELSQDVAGH